MLYKIDAGKLFLFSVTAFFCAYHLTFVILSESERKIPSDPDDAYHAIIKASNISNCFNSKCIGLNDLYEQTNQDFNNYNQGMFADRQEHRILFSYHPLYSYLIATINKFGFSYEDSKLITDILGVLLLCFSVILFLTSFFGIIPAAIATLSLISWSMMGHGMLQVNYVMFSFSFALIAWSFHVIKGNYYLNSIISFIALFFASMSHTVGIIYILVSFAFVFLKEFLKKYRLSKKILFQLLSTATLIIFYFLIDISFIDEKTTLAGLYDMNNSYGDMFSRNLLGIKSFLFFLNQNMSILFAIIFALTGLLFTKKIHKKNLLIMVVILSGLFLSTLLAPNIPGDAGSTILYRISPIFYIFLYGLIGIAGSQIFIADNINFMREIIAFKSIANNKLTILKIFISIAVLSLSISTLINNLSTGNQKIKENQTLDNVFLDEQQVKTLLSISLPDERVLYISGTEAGDRIGEAINYFYLTHGASKRGFIWNELVKNNNSNDYWLEQNVKYLVAKNPVIENGFNSNIKIGENNISINLGNVAYKNFYIKLRGGDASKLIIRQGKKLRTISGPFTGWTLIPNFIETNKIIELSSPNEILNLDGIKFDNQITNWPWASDVIIEMIGENKKINFNLNELFDNKKLKIKNVIDDNGASVLAEIKLNYE